MRITLLLAVCFLNMIVAQAQEENLKWWNPAESNKACIEGQGWSPEEIGTYSRLPDKAKTLVRKAVWNLSQNSAGLCIRFRSNSNRIFVRYKVTGGISMPHMPATGVSGVDMYAKIDGDWAWCGARYAFGDTIRYDYRNLHIESPNESKGREFCIYLPLYNTVDFLEIGVQEDALFEVMPIRIEKPIVVYGTSIAQGACASRPGMAWTAILSRALNLPIINLGYSGNGKFEEEHISLMSEIDAKLYVLDCLPNMTPGSGITHEETYDRIIKSVKQFRQISTETPILLVEHSGYSDGALNKDRFLIYSELNEVLRRAFNDLLSEGTEQIYLLTKEEIGQDRNSFVDGTHPSDLGMMRYAEAYEKKIREIIEMLIIETKYN